MQIYDILYLLLSGRIHWWLKTFTVSPQLLRLQLHVLKSWKKLKTFGPSKPMGSRSNRAKVKRKVGHPERKEWSEVDLLLEERWRQRAVKRLERSRGMDCNSTIWKRTVMIHIGYTASLTLLSLRAIILPIPTHLTIHAYSSLHIVCTIATYQPLPIPVLYP